MAPSPANATLLLFAELNIKSGAVQPAIEEPERFLAHQPKAAPALVLPGSTHLARREPARATEVYRRLIALAPEDPHVSDPLGWILYRPGLHQRALALLKDSAARLPGNPQYHLGMVSAQLGDKEAARQAPGIA